MSLVDFLEIYNRIDEGEDYKGKYGNISVERDRNYDLAIMRTDWMPLGDIHADLVTLEHTTYHFYMYRDGKLREIDLPLNEKELIDSLAEGEEVRIYSTWYKLGEEMSLEDNTRMIIRIRDVEGKIVKKVENYIYSKHMETARLMNEIADFLLDYSPTQEEMRKAYGRIPLPRNLREIVYTYL